MSIYGNVIVASAFAVVIYIVYAVIREYTGVDSWRGILMIIRMRKEERTQLKKVVLTPETSILRDKYRKSSTMIKNRIDELQSRSGVDREILYLYSVVWIIQNLLPSSLTKNYVIKVHALLRIPHSSPSKLLEYVVHVVNNDLVNTELPAILRQTVLNNIKPSSDSDQECILLNIVAEFLSTLTEDVVHVDGSPTYGTTIG